MVLTDITVLDLTRQLPGPFCTQMLGDFGATIIKIEDPRGGDPLRVRGGKAQQESGPFMALNRNKKSVVIDLKNEKGREVFLRLAERADVVVESFRPGVVARLGIDYKAVKAINEGIVYCSISGYGQDGPYRTRPGHDVNYIGIGGMLGLTGYDDGPPVIPGGQTADIYSGLHAALGIVLALFARYKSGNGHYIDISMLDCVVASLPHALGEFMATGKIPRRGRMILNGGYACYTVYETKDGGFMSLGALEPHFWEAFCRVIGREDFIHDQYAFSERQKEMASEIAHIFKGKTREEWAYIWVGVDVPCEPVLAFDETLTHPQIRSRKAVEEARHPTEGMIRYFRNPLRFEGTQWPMRLLPPRLGEHTEEVLRSADYSEHDIEALRKDKVI